MAEVAKGIIDIEINTGSAASQLKSLQAQINAFNLALNKGSKIQGAYAAEYAKELQLAINRTGAFTAEAVRLNTAAATLDKTLSKGKTSLGQFFSAKFNKDSAVAAEVMALAAERARRMQTQFVATSAAANGLQEALAIRPMAQFSSEMAITAQKSQILASMFRQGTTQLINFGKNVQWAGRQLMVGFTVPLTIFGNTAGRTFMELERQLISFKKVYGDIFTTPAELNQNLEAVTGLAKEYTKYGIAVKDTIGLAAQAAAAGRKNADLTDAVAQATRLATLGQMDQNAALETTISLQSAFRLSGEELADTINFLNMVENQTVVSLQDLAAAIPRVAPVIQGLGGDVKDLSVFLAAMQEGGVDAAEGANALKSGLASLINPTKQATQMLSGMGINLQAIIDANKGDLMATVMAFSQALASLDQFSRQQALEQVFGKFQYAKLGALFENISREGSQAQQVIATMGYTTEQLGATAEKELKTIEQSFGVQLTGAVERFKLAIAPVGEIFVKLAIPIVNFLTRIIEKFNGLSDGQKQFIAIATVITGIVIPAGTMLFGLLMNLTGTLLKMSQSFGAFAKGLVTGGPLGAIKALTQSSKYLSLSEIDAAMAAQQLSVASEAVNIALQEQAVSAKLAETAIDSLVQTYMALISTQNAAARMQGFAVPGAAANAAKNIRTGGSGFRVRRSLGGPIPGSGSQDTIPAMLTPGEFVVNKEATRRSYGLLKAINDGNIQGFNGGGLAALRSIGLAAFNRRRDGVSALTSISTVGRSGAFFAGEKARLFAALSQKRQAFGGFRRVNTRGRTASGRISGSSNTSYSGVQGGTGYSPYTAKDIDNLIGPEFDEFGGANARNALVTSLKKQPGQRSAEMVFGHALTPEFLQQTAGYDVAHRGAYPRQRVSQLAGRIYGVKERDIANDSLMDVLPSTGAVIRNPFNTQLRTGTATGSTFGRAEWYHELEFIKFLKEQGVSPSDIVRITRRSAEFKNRFMASYNGNIDEALWGEIQNRAENVAIRSLNSGGIVPGSGNTDTVPAMLTPGEFVINKKASKENMGLLKGINDGSVQGYALGGIVGGLGMAAAMGGQFIPNQGIGSAVSLAGTAAMLAGPLMNKNLISSLKDKLPIAVGRSILGFSGVGAALAVTGFAIYKLNKSITNAEKAGAEFTKAMYGSAKTTQSIAEAFGRQTFAQQARIAAVERIGGQEISQEAQQASLGFVQSEAGQQMLRDVGTVKAAGGNAVEALRNQLSSAIIAGAINTEEARAIAVEIGTALKDQSLSLGVSAEITRLMGPDGRDMLKNISTITAEISPKIDINKVTQDAQKAYEKLGAGERFVQLFQGGEDAFKENFKLQQAIAQNVSVLQRELEARELINIAYREGAIALEEFNSKRKAVEEGSVSSQNAIAKSLGFASMQDLVTAGQGTALISRNAMGQDVEVGRSFNAQQERAKAVLDEYRTSYETMIKEIPGMTDDVVEETMSSLDKIGGSIFADLISGNVSEADIPFIIKFQTQGLSYEQINKTLDKMEALRKYPEIDAIINIENASAQVINSAYAALEKFDGLKSPITKELLIETAGFDVATSQINQFLKLAPEIQKKILILLDVEVKTKISNVQQQTTRGQDSEVINKATLNAINNAGKSALDKLLQQGTDGLLGTPTPTENQGGGGKSFNDILNNLMNRFDIVSKRLDIEAQKYQDIISLQERQNELDQRSIEENQRALDQLTKQEDAVNKAYDARISALDGVTRANERLKQQEQSRISLATALASGDIAGAASAMSEISATQTANQLEDARAALELQREEDLKNLKVEINGQLLTREEINLRIDAIEENIYQRNLKVRDAQDSIYQLEQQRLANSREREKVETRLFLIQQRKAITELEGKNTYKRLGAEDRAALTQFKSGYNEMVNFFNSTYGENLQTVMYGGKIKKYAMGGMVFRRKDEAPPPLKMRLGNIVPGKGNLDRVPALLTPGEFVVRKSAAEANMPLLKMINSGSFPSISGPSYTVPQSDFGVNNSGTVQQNTGVVYNDTYNINVNVSGTNASPEDIANVVLSKMSQFNAGNVRGIRY